MNFIINRKVFISMLFIGLSMLGYFSYKSLPIELFPNAEEPVFYINIVGASEVAPEYMEKQAIVPIEGVVGTLEGIEQIESIANAGRGTITLTYNKDTDIKYAYLELLEKIDIIRATLPEEFNVQVSKSDLEMLNSLFIALQVRGSGGVNRVRDFTDKEVKPELENIDGIASAQVFGGREKTIEIILDSKVSEAYGITPNTVRNLIAQNNKSRTFVGEVVDGNQRQFVNVSAEYKDIRHLESIVVREQGPVLLGDVADIFFGVKEETTISRVNGKEAVTVQLVRDTQVNMIDLSHRTLEAIDRLNDKFKGQDMEIVVQFNMAEIMEKNIDQIMELAIIGGILAVFVLWIFLRNIRLVLAIGVSIPISVYTAFNFFYAYGISINSLTLIGMALAIGMLVDNSVVVLENIYRHAGTGKSKAKSVVEGTSEIRRSVLAATLTTITIFVPFLFSDNLYVKLIGNHIGVSIISTLLVSLFVALLLIPMLSYLFMKNKDSAAFRKVSIHDKLIRFYIVILKASMRKPSRVVIGTLVVFFATVLIGLLVSVASNQEVETDNVSVTVTMDGGSTLDMADEIVQEIEEKIGKIEEVEDISSTINEENASLQLKLKEDYKEIARRDIADIKSDIVNRTREINAAIDVNNSASMNSGGGGGGGRRSNRGGSGFQSFLGIGEQIETIAIKGEDFEEMRQVAEDIKFYLEQLSTVQNVNLSIADNRPEVHMDFDQRMMSQYGLTLNDVTNELSGFQPEFISGTTFTHGLEEYDITIKTDDFEEDEDVSRTMDDLKELDITSQTGSVHDLQDLSEVYFATGMWGISRLNQEKEIEVTYSFFQEYNESSKLLEGAKIEVADMLASLTLPSGIAVEQIETEDELAEFKFLITAAVILIFMILASIFESFVTPFVLMFAIPLATIGSFFALILTGNSIMNPNSLTGLLILLGVVVNNSIILIDYSNILRRRGYRRVRALMTAGIARVRPILITAITTIVAMFPLAMGQMEYVAVIGAPFAITVIGGLILSTLLTLVFIPTLNIGLESAIAWIRSLGWKPKIIQLAAMAVIIWLIYDNVDSTIWQSIFFMTGLIGIPALTYLVLKSLQQANEEVIPRDKEIIIRIENLVKIYGRANKLQRDWKGGNLRTSRIGAFLRFDKWKDFATLIYEIPVSLFLIYFTFLYLEGGFWIFPFAIASYVYLIKIIELLGKLRSLKWDMGWIRKMGRIFFLVVYWGLPLVMGTYWYLTWDNLAGPIILMIPWYFGLAINMGARNLKDKDINPEHIKNRVKRNFYHLVYKIPIIGKKRDSFKALKGVSLEIGNGMFGLLGPNGAGKTTLMRTICGIFEQSYGKIWFNEFDTQLHREELQGLIGYLPQEFGMYENMTPYEYLSYQAILKGITNISVREDRIRQVLESVNMYEKRDEKIGSFSGGMKQRIGIAQILLHLPRVLVVDEPTAGLDPRERIRFRNLLVELSRDRIVIFSTHIIEDIASSCRQVAVLNKGELKYSGTPTEMATIAEGKVWQFHVKPEEFEEIATRMKIVHHMNDGNMIRVRCLAEKKPAEDAIPVKPILEDSYLWLMKDSGQVLSKLEG